MAVALTLPQVALSCKWTAIWHTSIDVHHFDDYRLSAGHFLFMLRAIHCLLCCVVLSPLCLVTF